MPSNPLSSSGADRPLELPPPFTLVTLREAGDAFAHACAVARASGAGTLVWTKRFDVAEFAVVLEPEEPLRLARRAFFVGMNALADALAASAPPERPIGFDWPDAIRVDGVLVGGGRLGWPDISEDDVPEWLVFAGTIRTAIIRAGEPGLRPLLGSLDELGFEAIAPAEILSSFARHLMAGFHELSEDGLEPAFRRFQHRMAKRASAPFSIGTGEVESAGSAEPAERLGGPHHDGDPYPSAHATRSILDREKKAASADLRKALAAPSWLDPKTGMPWL